MKKLYALLILMMPLSVFALSNAEVRNSIQVGVIDSSTFPQDLGDGVTSLTGISTSTRGIEVQRLRHIAHGLPHAGDGWL